MRMGVDLLSKIGVGLPTFCQAKKAVGWAHARLGMPSAHESVHPAHHARTCAWLRAAARLLSPGFDGLSAAGWFWLCQKGQKPPFLAFSTRLLKLSLRYTLFPTQAWYYAEFCLLWD